MTHDRVLKGFLERQCEEGIALAGASDLFDLELLGPPPVAAYFARFRCTGLMRRNGQVVEHNDSLVGVHFSDDYLRRFETDRVLTWCAPSEIWHPNIRPPYICAGQMQPGTPLVDLIFQIYEIITYHNVEMREHNALNHDACVWARHNQYRFPIDRRPLCRRRCTVPDGHPKEG